jgi:hypothetical protein
MDKVLLGVDKVCIHFFLSFLILFYFIIFLACYKWYFSDVFSPKIIF